MLTVMLTDGKAVAAAAAGTVPHGHNVAAHLLREAEASSPLDACTLDQRVAHGHYAPGIGTNSSMGGAKGSTPGYFFRGLRWGGLHAANALVSRSSCLSQRLHASVQCSGCTSANLFVFSLWSRYVVKSQA